MSIDAVLAYARAARDRALALGCYDPPPPDPRPSHEGAPPLREGDECCFLGSHLRNTGRCVSNAGTERWKVIGCQCELCELGRHVRAVCGEAERHIARAHLRRWGEPAMSEAEAMIEFLAFEHGARIATAIVPDTDEFVARKRSRRAGP